MRLLLILWLSGCSASGLTLANRVGLGVSTATVACDWGQTRAAAADGWQGRREGNPLMGPTPTVSTVDVYFLAIAGLNAIVWAAAPRRLKLAVPIVVALLQGYVVAKNVWLNGADDVGICGIR